MLSSHTLDEGPFSVTSFAIGERYEEELKHLLHSIADVYVLETNRPMVLVGRVQGTTMRLLHHHLSTSREEIWAEFDIPKSVVESITSPATFHSWWPIVRLKGWWLHELWKQNLGCPLIWLDADARLHRRLDLEIPDRDFLGAHWVDFEKRQALHSGTLILQGDGVVPTLKETAERCDRAAYQLPLQGHQEILQQVALDLSCPLLSLPDSYCTIAMPGVPPSPDAVVAHWQAHRCRIDPSWPPPEASRVLDVPRGRRL
jgi:hypothetical protein